MKILIFLHNDTLKTIIILTLWRLNGTRTSYGDIIKIQIEKSGFVRVYNKWIFLLSQAMRSLTTECVL